MTVVRRRRRAVGTTVRRLCTQTHSMRTYSCEARSGYEYECCDSLHGIRKRYGCSVGLNLQLSFIVSLLHDSIARSRFLCFHMGGVFKRCARGDP